MARYWPLAAILIGVAVWFGLDLLKSDETRIQEVIEDLRDQFNSQRAGGIVENLSETYEDGPSGVDKVTLRGAFARSFLQHRTQGPYPYRVEIAPGSLSVTLPESADAGGVSVELVFYRRKANSEKVQWRLQVDGKVVRESGNRWRIVHTDWRTLEGQRPF